MYKYFVDHLKMHEDLEKSFAYFDLKIFLSGFFGNSILSIALTYLGNKLNVDIYLAAIVVFVGRMFTNLAIIRRYYLEKWIKFAEKMKENKTKVEESE